MPVQRNRIRRKNPPKLVVHPAPTELERLHAEAINVNQQIRRLIKFREGLMKKMPPRSATPESREMLMNDLNEKIKEIRKAKNDLDILRRKINAEMILQNKKNG